MEREQHGATEEKLPPPGIAGRIAGVFIDSPITPMLMVAMLVIGVLGLLFTPRQEDPQISVPMVDIFVGYPGADAEQVASLVSSPLERILSEIPGIRHVYSATRRGETIITVQFKVGEEPGPSLVKVHDKLQSNMDIVPPGVASPLIKLKGIDDVPVVSLTLWSDDLDDSSLRNLALDVLQELREIRETGQGLVVGGRSEQIRIEVLPERLDGYNISLDAIAEAVRNANQETRTGNIEAQNRYFTVYSGTFLKSAQDLSQLVIAVRDGAPVYLRDVANISHLPAETGHLVNHYSGPAATAASPEANGANAVTIAIAKKSGTNGVTVTKKVLEKVEELKTYLIPNNVEVSVTRDYGKSANNKVNELLQALFEAAAIVSLLCLIGLGLRAAFVVVTVIPIVILVTVFAAWVLDYTIDRVSLFALIFSIGILVDDATVVVENIFRRWMEAGKTSLRVAVDAVREVGNPTILATLTIIAALLPMGVVRGMMGPYMLPIPVLGAAAMFFSLLAAFVFTPWFAMRVRPSSVAAFRKAERREQRSQKAMGKIFRPVIMPLIKNRRYGQAFLFGVIALTALVCVLFYTQHVAVKMLPFDNKSEFNVVINMPEGTALPDTANVTTQLAEALREIPEVTQLQTYVGTASPFNFNGLVRHYYLRQEPHQADIQVLLLDKDNRERSSHEISVAARELLQPIAKQNGARIQVVEMPPGPPVLQTVVTEIYGPDAETRRQVARDMTQIFEEVEGIVDVDNYLSAPHQYWRFEINNEKAIRNGIDIATINRNLDMVMGGYRIGDVKRGALLEPTYIVLQAPLAERSNLERMLTLPIMNSEGKSTPLGELGKFVLADEDPIIFRKDLRGVEYVTGEMAGRLGAPIYGMFGVENALEDYTAPDGVKISGMPMGLLGAPDTDRVSGFEWAGEWTVTYETFRDMGAAFMVALLLIYTLIVLEFKDYAIAGLIMSPIPLTLIGIIPGHWLLGAEFTATSMIGMIALGGIVVRVSILLVEFVKIETAAGKDIREAAVNAAQTRLRPILITSLTLMAGAFAIISDPIFQGMAVSLLFGAGVATLFTLLVIPLGCISLEKRFPVGDASSGAGGAAVNAPDFGMVVSRESFEKLNATTKSQTEKESSSGENFTLKSDENLTADKQQPVEDEKSVADKQPVEDEKSVADKQPVEEKSPVAEEKPEPTPTKPKTSTTKTAAAKPATRKTNSRAKSTTTKTTAARSTTTGKTTRAKAGTKATTTRAKPGTKTTTPRKTTASKTTSRAKAAGSSASKSKVSEQKAPETKTPEDK